MIDYNSLNNKEKRVLRDALNIERINLYYLEDNGILLMEAKELLKLVYRDFLATEDERNFIIQKEHKILETSENKKEKVVEKAQKEEVEKVLENAQKNEVEKVLENSQKEEVKEKEEENQPIKNLQLIKVEEKWYKKLIRKLKNLVNRVKM